MSDKARFQQRSVEEGRTTQEIARSVLAGAGFLIVDRNKKLADCGITANYVALDKQKDEWVFDVSGAFETNVPGLVRTDTMWKTLGRMNVLYSLGYKRVLILTTNLPPKGTVGDRALRATAKTFFDAVEMLPQEGRARLAHYAKGGKDLLPLPGYRTASDIYEGQPTLFGAAMSVPAGDVAIDIPIKASKVTALPHRIEVIVPSLDHLGKPIAVSVLDAVRRKVREMLNKVGRGSTAQEAMGSWIHPVEGEMQEGIYAVQSFSPEPFTHDFVNEVANVILDDLQQHTAAIIVGDRMYQFESQEHV